MTIFLTFNSGPEDGKKKALWFLPPLMPGLPALFWVLTTSRRLMKHLGCQKIRGPVTGELSFSKKS